MPPFRSPDHDMRPRAAGSEHWRLWLLWAVGGGRCFLAGGALVCQYRFHRRVGRLRPLTDGPTLNLLEDCKVLMGVTHAGVVIETEAVKGPDVVRLCAPALAPADGAALHFHPGGTPPCLSARTGPC